MAFCSFGQATFILNAPVNDGSTSGNRFPNGTSAHTYFRGASLILATELSSIPVSTTLSSIGFTNTTGATTAVTGTITIYMQNTTDMSFLKGTTWSGVTPGMTAVYVGTITIPNTITAFDIPLTTPFAFTNGGLYVAYDFQSAGPFSTGACIWASNSTGLVNGCISGPSSSAPPTTCSASSFRPCMRLGYPNSLTNDVSVDYVNTMGDVALALSIPTIPLSAIVKNVSSGPLSNIPVTANMTGANTFANTQTITSLAAGASTTVNFGSGWMPLTQGASTITVSVPADQNNANNSMSFSNMATCNTGGFAQDPASYLQSVGFGTLSGILSTSVQLPTSANVTGVSMAISSNTANVGNNVYGVMLDNTGNILTTSINTLNIANGDLNTIRSFTFTTPQNVTAAQVWYIGMAQTPNTVLGYYPYGAYTSPYLNSAYFTNAITGGALSLLTANLGQFGIKAEFGGICGPLGVKSIPSSDNNLTVYPNPASTTLNVKLGSVSDKATVTVYNAIGQIMIASQEITNNATEINVSALAKGVYILKVSNGKEVSNTKFVIER